MNSFLSLNLEIGGDILLELFGINLALKKLKPEDLPLFLLSDFRHELLLLLLGSLVPALEKHQLSLS